jgi:hypothetical protein
MICFLSFFFIRLSSFSCKTDECDEIFGINLFILIIILILIHIIVNNDENKKIITKIFLN